MFSEILEHSTHEQKSKEDVIQTNKNFSEIQDTITDVLDNAKVKEIDVVLLDVKDIVESTVLKPESIFCEDQPSTSQNQAINENNQFSYLDSVEIVRTDKVNTNDAVIEENSITHDRLPLSFEQATDIPFQFEPANIMKIEQNVTVEKAHILEPIRTSEKSVINATNITYITEQYTLENQELQPESEEEINDNIETQVAKPTEESLHQLVTTHEISHPMILESLEVIEDVQYSLDKPIQTEEEIDAKIIMTSLVVDQVVIDSSRGDHARYDLPLDKPSITLTPEETTGLSSDESANIKETIQPELEIPKEFKTAFEIIEVVKIEQNNLNNSSIGAEEVNISDSIIIEHELSPTEIINTQPIILETTSPFVDTIIISTDLNDASNEQQAETQLAEKSNLTGNCMKTTEGICSDQAALNEILQPIVLEPFMSIEDTEKLIQKSIEKIEADDIGMTDIIHTENVATCDSHFPVLESVAPLAEKEPQLFIKTKPDTVFLEEIKSVVTDQITTNEEVVPIKVMAYSEMKTPLEDINIQTSASQVTEIINFDLPCHVDESENVEIAANLEQKPGKRVYSHGTHSYTCAS